MSGAGELSAGLSELWRAVFDTPPPPGMTNDEMLDGIVAQLSPPPYTTIRRCGVISPFGEGATMLPPTRPPVHPDPTAWWRGPHARRR